MKNMARCLFVGDIHVNSYKRKPVDKDLGNFIAAHDLASCNFEGPAVSKSEERCKIEKIGPSIRQNIKTPDLLIKTGFNVFNLANNHVYDYSETGLRKTIARLAKNLIIGAGDNFASAYSLKTKTVFGNKIGFLAFAEWQFGAITGEDQKKGGFAWINHPKVNSIIAHSKRKVDILIVQVHAGVEGVELPLPEWRERYRQLVDYGADLVIGHHPHVVQGWETYRGRYIFYSLGDFYFDSINPNIPKGPGLIVSASIARREIVSVDTRLTETCEGTVCFSRNGATQKHLADINRLLNSPIEYITATNNLAVKLWQDRYKEFYFQAFLSSESLLFRGYKREINRKLLLHNLKIESHLWAVQRALMVLENEI